MSIYGYEALLRGPILPEELFDRMAKIGLTHHLDLFSHHLACTSIQLPVNQKLFLNCHPQTLPHLQSISLPADSKLLEQQIVIEITEQHQVDIAILEKSIHLFKKLGIQIALDDFGSGYNNFYLLQNIVPDYIKLDRGIIQNVKEKRTKKFLIDIIRWAAEHDVVLIAEGIEKLEHLQICLQMGIHKGQGWFLGKPQPNIEYQRIKMNVENSL